MRNSSQKKGKSKTNTASLQAEVEIMEERLSGLRQVLQYQKEVNKERTQTSNTGSTRWSAASLTQPLKTYNNNKAKKQQQLTFKNNKSNSKSRSSSMSKTSTSKSQFPQISQQAESKKDTILSQALNLRSNDQVTLNLSRAIQLQQQQSNEVVKYLQKLNLEKYASILLENGFDELEILDEIQIDHCKQMKIAPKDAQKLLISIQKSQQEKSQLIEEQKEKQMSQSSTSFKPSKFDGQFDEEANRKEFLEALMNFRSGNQEQTTENDKQKEKKDKKEKKQVIFEVDEGYYNNQDESLGYVSSRLRKQEEDQKNKMKFLLGGSQLWENLNFDLQLDNNIITENQRPIILNKTSCYQCYKVISAETQYRINEAKAFCSQNCLSQYQTQNMYLCRACTCQKEINIESAFYQVGQWFCNEECFKQFKWENTNIRGTTRVSL